VTHRPPATADKKMRKIDLKSLVGEVLMILRTSAIAACCSSASASLSSN